jgi:thiamine biosynthesis lipoprotein
VVIEARHSEVAIARLAVQRAFEEIERVEQVMSLYRSDSQVCRLNRDGRLERPDPMLVEVLQSACTLSRRTRGAFDVTVQPLWEVFAGAQREGRSVTEADRTAALARVDWRHLSVSSERLALSPGMAITLNGIAQGYATDRATAVLRECGIEHALVNAGEVGALGTRGGEPWCVGIQHPREPEAYIALAKLAGRCVSTSGDYATTFSNDRRSNHLFDPRTGRSPDEFASVTVVAPTAMQADGLSTAISVLGLERGEQLLNETPDCDALFVLKDGRTFQTAEFPV